MILAHTIIGVNAGDYFGHFWYILIGSIIPDIDHIFVLAKNKIYTPSKIIDTMRFEKNYNLEFKTKYVHSVLGAIAFSLPVALIDFNGAIYFFFSYIFHLIIDWLDYDEKQYLFPLKTKFKGFLPIFSKQEIFITIILIVLMIYSFS